MDAGDRPRDQHPDNVVFWRLSSLEEALKYQSGQLTELRERLDTQPDRLAREFPTRLEVQREYVAKADVRQAAGDTRDVWTLRLIAFGTLASCALGVFSVLHG